MQTLGIDPEKEPGLLSLAEEGFAAPVPPGMSHPQFARKIDVIMHSRRRPSKGLRASIRLD